MRNLVILACIAAVIGFGPDASAIEGGAKFVDTISGYAASSDSAEAIGVRIDSDTEVVKEVASWSVVAAVGVNTVDIDMYGEVDGWLGELGAKYYMDNLTAVSAYVSYEEFDAFGFDDVVGANVSFSRHFMDTRKNGISPFIVGTGAFRFKDYRAGDALSERDDTDVLLKGLIGCDFMLSESVAMVLSASYTWISDDAEGGDSSDAFGAMLGFKAYWD